MTKRLALLALLAGVLAAIPGSDDHAQAAFPGKNGRIAFVRSAGVAKPDLNAPDVTIQPEYDYRHGQKLTGYRVARQVTIRVRDLDRLGTILDGVVGAGANEVQGTKLRFRVTDNGSTVYRATMSADSQAFVKLRYAKGTGKHKVQILKNGAVDQTFVLHMGR